MLKNSLLMKIILFLVCVLVLSACASSSTISPKDEIAARHVTPAQDTVTYWDSKSGLVIIGVRAFDMNNRDKISKNRAVLTGISIKNLATNTIYRIALNADSAVKIVPNGTYCINSFRTYWNVDLNYCKDPMFSIISGQATNLGYIFLGVNYKAGPGAIRIWPYSLYKYKRELSQNLTADEHQAVRDFLEKSHPDQGSISNTVWYSYDQGGNPYALWFNKGGKFFFQLNPGNALSSAHEGTWKTVGNKITFALEKYDRYYEGSITGDFMSGIGRDSEDGSQWVWFATKDPTVQPSFNTSSVAKVIYLDSTLYPKDALAKGITGFVRIHYKLPLPDEALSDISPTVTPESMKVVESKPEGVFDKAALDAFQYAFFANAIKDGKPVTSDGEETITYNIVNGKPVVRYSSKLEPLEAPQK